MRLALAEAQKALGRTRPNPAVGAVVVRGSRVVALGHHRKAGRPHAEAEALAVAGERARGATLYVTLEPCCHTGRTGPCTEAVLQAGVARVVVGCRDANPKVDGRGIARLRRAGVQVVVGCLEQECLALNRAFFCWIRENRPLVTLKFAATLDGVIGTRRSVGEPPAVHWITGAAARAHAHQLRAQHHAIVVGRGTVEADDPQLTVRATRLPPGGHRGIARVVLDSHLRTSPKARLLTQPAPGPPPLFVAASPPPRQAAAWRKREAALQAAGAEVLALSPARPGRPPPLAVVLQALAERQVQSLLVEGGQQVLSAFVQEGLVDQVVAYLAPRLAGGGITITAGVGRALAEALPLTQVTTRWLGPDLLLTAQVDRG